MQLKKAKITITTESIGNLTGKNCPENSDKERKRARERKRPNISEVKQNMIATKFKIKLMS